ncbi:TPA: hypothetical protein PWS73_002989, partial [Enterococcus faecium]|nr:hypothetical protein [Enterococcus faecium]
IFSDEYVEIIISDHSKNTKEIAKKIEEKKVFDGCHYLESKSFDDNIGYFQKIKDCLQISCGKSNRYAYYLKNCKSEYFDEFICFSMGEVWLEGIYACLYRNNKNVQVSILEEGILSYGVDIIPTARTKAIAVLNYLKKRTPLYNKSYNFYCFFPNIYTGRENTIQIPLVTAGSRTALQLSDIFNPMIDIYKEKKYIFFTSVYDFEGGEPVGEYELVCKIADLVGKDNLIVKTHPRDVRTIYKDNGFIEDKNSSIPWEAIQLSGDFNDKIFMTINSGSVISGSTMSAKPVRTYYMYKLCNIEGNPSCKKNAYDIERLLKQKTMKNILKNVKI